jgi:hypothetical protein
MYVQSHQSKEKQAPTLQKQRAGDCQGMIAQDTAERAMPITKETQ